MLVYYYFFFKVKLDIKNKKKVLNIASNKTSL